MPKRALTVELLCHEAHDFAAVESSHPEPSLYGVTDGKAIGTYFEHKFRALIETKYTTSRGNSAKGIDFPSLEVDMKATSIKQPQSSCPFKSARQKVYGLGYSLLVFVYDKKDLARTKTGTLNVLHTLFIEKERTGDFQTTKEIRRLLENGATEEDLVAFMQDRYQEIEAFKLARELLDHPPEQGYLTISNALQWRLQYGRAVTSAGQALGVRRIR
ncbi:MAG: hypothetical protein KF708_11020 [Pirellulales bacterium]|nr:hypothetical protein [Pirellulales bacterium]